METSPGATTLALDTNTFAHRGLLRLNLRSAEGADFEMATTADCRSAKGNTELEFEIAGELGLPRLIFLLDEEADVPLPASRIIDLQHGLRQANFRRRLREEA